MHESTASDEPCAALVRNQNSAFPAYFANGSSVCAGCSACSADGSLYCAHGSSFPTSCANGSAFSTYYGLPLKEVKEPPLSSAQVPTVLQHRRAASTSACALLAEELCLSAFPTVGSALLATVSAVQANGLPDFPIVNANVTSGDEPAVCFSLNSSPGSPGSSAFSLEDLPLLSNEPSSPEGTCCPVADTAINTHSSRRKDIWASRASSGSISRVPSCSVSRADSLRSDSIAWSLRKTGNSADTDGSYGTPFPELIAAFSPAVMGFKVGSSCEDGSHVLSFENIDIQGEEHVAKGVTLTWKDLWVTISDKSKPGIKSLLQNSTGFAEPSNMMAIMGPSGSGKSTLLDALAGRLSPNLKQVGNVMVNGRRQTLSYGNSAYVTQDDVLLASLTVWEAVYYSAQLQLPKTMSYEAKRKRAERIIKEMGLQGAINTRIGGWRARGLSGGEKRRVSIAIELLTRPRLLFLDEPTSGLDSAAAFNVVKRLRRLAVEGRTIIVSIHQPSGDVFELFDYLYLLSSGRTVYFGSAGQAREFFCVNGLPCPPHQNPSEHYLRTINADYEEETEDVAADHRDLKTKQVIHLLVEAYANSNVLLEVSNRIKELLKEEGELLHTASDHPGFLTHVRVLTRRSFRNMHRDLGYYWLRLVMYIALTICIGTVYYNVGFSFSAIQARAALLMFVSGLLTFMSITGFPAYIEELKVFDRERLNGHYGVAPFFIANTLSSAPYLLMISIIPGAIAYFLAGLHAGFDRFAFFVLAIYVSVLVVESIMMMVASLVSDYLVGILIGTGIQGLYLLTGGFFRLPNEIPKPLWKYPVFYMSFHSYSIQGFYKNDFEGLIFASNIAGQPPLSGDAILINNFQVMNFSKWYDLLILLGMAVGYRLIFFVFVKSRERLRPAIRSFLTRMASLKVFSNGDDQHPMVVK
ncbi:hypothetical protein GOP47_0013574 [Adiantum capillus-veneris]|uniref:ABC transporter domain-containing protein n=1 Tax=Adiantum capillus-veneris TaxID=13818 RepID=A0A9D4UNS5_ADICA|nr:hypothetical protein GOP47_0013574 [Adiantum capillus-veneris]